MIRFIEQKALKDDLETHISKCERNWLSRMEDKLQAVIEGMHLFCVFGIQTSLGKIFYFTFIYVKQQNF